MSDVKPIPDGYTAITPYLCVEGASAYIDFLANAFGAVERMRIPLPDDLVAHAEVTIDGAVVMLSDAFPPDSPAQAAHIHLYVEDVDAAYARAVNAGATSDGEPKDEFYGEGEGLDPIAIDEALAAHADLWLELIAKATGRDASWLASLPDGAGEDLSDAMWSANGAFFVRRVVATVAARKRKASRSPSPKSSTPSSGPDTGGDTPTSQDA